MSQFPTAGHLLSWAGLTPRLDESAGKRRSTRINKGAPWLKPVLVQSAWAAARKKNSYLQAQFLRIKARRGAKKAAVAIAASILTIVYHMLRDGTCYQDLGPEYFGRRNAAKIPARLANESETSADPNSPFVRDAVTKLVRRGYWMDMDDRTLVMVMVNGIGAHLTNDGEAHLTDLKREHLIDQVCVQEILPPEKR